jgi:hypothetical protein
MLSVRVNTFNENGLGEPEQDANSALTELDKGQFIFFHRFLFFPNYIIQMLNF